MRLGCGWCIGSFIHRLIGSGWDDSDILSIFFCITGSYLGWVFFFWSIGPCGLLAKLWKLVASVFPAFFRSGFQCHVWATLVDQIEHHFPWLVVWNNFFFQKYWECHHPNWRSPSFFRGVNGWSATPHLGVSPKVWTWTSPCANEERKKDMMWVHDSWAILSHLTLLWLLW